jgi:hypothetical protein
VYAGQSPFLVEATNGDAADGAGAVLRPWPVAWRFQPTAPTTTVKTNARLEVLRIDIS